MKKSYSKLSKNESVCMCEEGWCVGIEQKVGSLPEGGGGIINYIKLNKRGWNREMGRGKKNVKKVVGRGMGKLGKLRFFTKISKILQYFIGYQLLNFT